MKKRVPYPFPSDIPQYSTKPRIKNLDYWKNIFDPHSPRWYGWEEFINFYRIRHCFAHNNGKLLSSQTTCINDFLNKLNKKEVVDRDNTIIKPYYKIDSDDNIVINNDALFRIRILCMEFLVLSTVIDPIKLRSGEIISF